MTGRLLDWLKGGTVQSLGRTEEVVAIIEQDEAAYDEVFEGLFDEDPVVRLRATDAIEKASRTHPEWLVAWQDEILGRLDEFEGHDVQQMHIALLIKHMDLSLAQARRMLTRLERWSRIDHKFMLASCMSGLMDLGLAHPALYGRAITQIETLATSDPAPSIQARARKLLKKRKA